MLFTVILQFNMVLKTLPYPIHMVLILLVQILKEFFFFFLLKYPAETLLYIIYIYIYIYMNCGKSTYRLHWKLKIILLLEKRNHLFLKLFSAGFRFGVSLFQLQEFFLHVGHLFLILSRFQQRLNLEVELHPGPILDTHEGTNVPLDNKQGISVYIK